MKIRNRIILIGVVVFLFVSTFIYVIPFVKPVEMRDVIDHFAYEVYDDYAILIWYEGNEKMVKIEDSFLGRPVKIIGYSAFNRNETLESVYFGKNVECIHPNAFRLCTELKNVILNEGLKEIGDGSFFDTWNLNTIDIPANVSKIGESAFMNSGLCEVNFASNNMDIGGNAFFPTDWLASQEEFAIFGDSILIGYQGTDTEVVVPYGVKTISGAFRDRSDIEAIYLPDTVTKIYNGSFYYCDNARIYIPESVTEIESMMCSTGDTLTIITTAGSCAEAFAKENGNKYEIVDEIPYPIQE